MSIYFRCCLIHCQRIRKRDWKERIGFLPITDCAWRRYGNIFWYRHFFWLTSNVIVGENVALYCPIFKKIGLIYMKGKQWEHLCMLAMKYIVSISLKSTMLRKHQKFGDIFKSLKFSGKFALVTLILFES